MNSDVSRPNSRTIQSPWCTNSASSYYVAGILIERESAKVVQAWFQGLTRNVATSPPVLLRGEPLDEIGQKDISSARSFALQA